MNIPFIDGLPMKNGDFPVRYPGQELVEELAADHEETALGRLTENRRARPAPPRR